jgi:cysteine-S-conjugate beta-lyase
MEKQKKQLNISTQTGLIHHPYQAPSGFVAPQSGTAHKASTVFFSTVEAMRNSRWLDKSSYVYGLHGTPASYLLEEKLAHLEGALQCLLVPSGLCAIALVFSSMLKSGDEVLIPHNVYGNARSLIEGEFATWGISHQYYDSQNLDDVKNKISTATKLLWIEPPGSVTLEFPDVVGLIALARKKNILVAADNSWGAGYAFNIFDLPTSSATRVGVDISVQALTKYHSGGGDILMGAVFTRDNALCQQLKMTHARFGLGVSADDVHQISRSLPTMRLRYDAEDSATQALARWALTRPEFSQVLHPALLASPGHKNWQALCESHNKKAGALLSVIFHDRYTQAQVDNFCNALLLFKLGYSWAGPVSLVVPYDLESMYGHNRPSYLAHGCVVRLAIGLESVFDLQSDLEQALRAL